MADGRDDRFNTLPDRGQKLRDTEQEYSDGLDWPTGRSDLNRNIRATEENHNAGHGKLPKCCKKLGLNLKEPLS